MIIEPALYTVAEAAVYLRYSAGKIYTMIHAKEIKAAKRGRSYLILKTSLDDYLNTHVFNNS
ncbi:helix-turn-helix domain-containing protein [Pectinatus frisingensis]|uniref:helix-turn-helix domain-containing protein n=1 Tax=Pectinatus frisingensis TaxID=865 RepID=UPI0018C5D23D|nr:helix-turn-helix domain-containing protein [Pectinatus frisingensis]